MFINNIYIFVLNSLGDINIQEAILEISDNQTSPIIKAIHPPDYIIPKDQNILDGQHQYLLPKAIEHHQHGAMGADWIDLANTDNESHQIKLIETILSAQKQAGISKSFITLVSTSYQNIKKILSAVYNYLENPKKNPALANIILGIHFEGPYISTHPGCIGAHDKAIVESVSFTDPENLITLINKFRLSFQNIDLEYCTTIDFSRENSLQFAQAAKANNIKIFIGHSDAGRKIIYQAIKQKLITGVTHFGNAMNNSSHKEISASHSETVSELLKYTKNIFYELIIDQDNFKKGNHLIQSFVKLCLEQIGPENILLVSDALSPTLMPEGRYKLGSLDVQKIGQCIYLLDHNNRPIKLAGNANLINRSIEIFCYYLQNFGYDKEEIAKIVILTTVINPIKVLSNQDKLIRRINLIPGTKLDSYSILSINNGVSYMPAENSLINLIDQKQTNYCTKRPLLLTTHTLSSSPFITRSPIPIRIHPETEDVGIAAANIIKHEIEQANKNGQQIVFIIPTGSTPLPMYRELIRLWAHGKINFENTIFFNMDEYHGLSSWDPNSYYSFMMQNFFSFLLNKPGGVKKQNINIPLSGETFEESSYNAQRYHEKLASYLKSQNARVVLFGGIGRGPAHIAFNDFTTELLSIPEAQKNNYALNTITRVVPLDEKTRIANQRFFGALSQVPTHAITIGLKEILACDRIIIMATDDSKKEALKSIFQGIPSHKVPASFLRLYKGQLSFLITNSAFCLFDSPEVAFIREGQKNKKTISL